MDTLSETIERFVSRGWNNPRSAQAGFSLIELSVVLVIIGLLVGGGIAAIDATRAQANRSDQADRLDRVRQAIYGFAMANGHIPCPDDLADGTPPDPDGREDRTAGDCSSDTGALPWHDLGLASRDAWGFPIVYHVDPVFADSSNLFELAEPPPSTVTVEDGNGNEIAATPAVILSVGPQGGQVWTSAGFACPGTDGDGAVTDGFSDDESANCDGDDRFIRTGYRTESAPAGRFDDMVIWLSAPLLKARLVEAGELPRSP